MPVTGIVEDFETEEIANNNGESLDEGKTFGLIRVYIYIQSYPTLREKEGGETMSLGTSDP